MNTQRNNISNSSVSRMSEVSNIDVNNMEYNPMKPTPIHWTPDNEFIIIEWCDVAKCYKWMNSRAHSIYTNYNALFTIPTIILSTISGTASFAINSLPPHAQQLAPIIIGSVNIFVGIITTIQQYLKIAELNEAYRVSSISWDKYARNIRMELAKSPKERTDADQFLTICRQEYDRLMETTPIIPSYIIDEFNKKFSGKPGSDTRKRFDELIKPDICNTITSANEYRYSWNNHLSWNKQLNIDLPSAIRDREREDREDREDRIIKNGIKQSQSKTHTKSHNKEHKKKEKKIRIDEETDSDIDQV